MTFVFGKSMEAERRKALEDLDFRILPLLFVDSNKQALYNLKSSEAIKVQNGLPSFVVKSKEEAKQILDKSLIQSKDLDKKERIRQDFQERIRSSKNVREIEAIFLDLETEIIKWQ